MTKNMELFYRQTNAKPLFANPHEEAELRKNFRKGLEPAIRDNAKRRAMSEMRARNDVRWSG